MAAAGTHTNLQTPLNWSWNSQVSRRNRKSGEAAYSASWGWLPLPGASAAPILQLRTVTAKCQGYRGPARQHLEALDLDLKSHVRWPQR